MFRSIRIITPVAFLSLRREKTNKSVTCVILEEIVTSCKSVLYNYSTVLHPVFGISRTLKFHSCLCLLRHHRLYDPKKFCILTQLKSYITIKRFEISLFAFPLFQLILMNFSKMLHNFRNSEAVKFFILNIDLFPPGL